MTQKLGIDPNTIGGYPYSPQRTTEAPRAPRPIPAYEGDPEQDSFRPQPQRETRSEHKHFDRLAQIVQQALDQAYTAREENAFLARTLRVALNIDDATWNTAIAQVHREAQEAQRDDTVTRGELQDLLTAHAQQILDRVTQVLQQPANPVPPQDDTVRAGLAPTQEAPAQAPTPPEDAPETTNRTHIIPKTIDEIRAVRNTLLKHSWDMPLKALQELGPEQWRQLNTHLLEDGPTPQWLESVATSIPLPAKKGPKK